MELKPGMEGVVEYKKAAEDKAALDKKKTAVKPPKKSVGCLLTHRARNPTPSPFPLLGCAHRPLCSRSCRSQSYVVHFVCVCVSTLRSPFAAFASS
jgi:hypothetical protein